MNLRNLDERREPLEWLRLNDHDVLAERCLNMEVMLQAVRQEHEERIGQRDAARADLCQGTREATVTTITDNHEEAMRKKAETAETEVIDAALALMEICAWRDNHAFMLGGIGARQRFDRLWAAVQQLRRVLNKA